METGKGSAHVNCECEHSKKFVQQMQYGIQVYGKSPAHVTDWFTVEIVSRSVYLWAVPMFKKGEKHLPANYWPVSLTSTTCKVLEHIVHNSIMTHFAPNDFMTYWGTQHGFRLSLKQSGKTQLISQATCQWIASWCHLAGFLQGFHQSTTCLSHAETWPPWNQEALSVFRSIHFIMSCSNKRS